MLKDKRPYYLFGAAALLLLAFFLVIRNSSDRFDWNETYEEEAKDPYNTFVIYQLMQNYFEEHTFKPIKNSITEELPIRTNDKANYVFVGEAMFMDTASVSRLLKFVENGNDAFISSKTIPYDLMFYVYYEECNDNYWEDYSTLKDTSVVLNMTHPSLKDSIGFEYRYVYRNIPKRYRWQYIDSVYFCEEEYSLVELGTLNSDHPNFAKVKYGEGHFYLHTTPIAFSNIQMKDRIGITYANKVFTHLEPGDIYWDEKSRVEESVGRRYNQMQSQSSNRGLAGESPLKYILAQPPLAWAWYLMLAVALLYVLFRAKRKQRIIPVLQPNTNTSMEFLSTIGSLYFLQNDHKKMSVQKMKLFLGFVRDRYYLPTSQLDEAFVDKLSAKSNIPKVIIEKILLINQNIESSSFVSEQTLIDFHLEIDKFYKNCK
ncbi:MAG: hypothetical protein AAF990_28650 [Bacteroidota bacterium]